MITEALLYSLPTCVEHNGLEFHLVLSFLPGPRCRLAYVGPQWQNHFFDGLPCNYLYEVDEIRNDQELLEASEEIGGFLIENLPEVMAGHWAELYILLGVESIHLENAAKRSKGGSAVHL